MSGVFPVLLLGAALLGLGTAANLQARFAAVDLADAGHRGRSLAIVVWAVTIGAVAGPNLIRPGAAVGEALGLPALAGPFVFSAAGLALAAVLLLIGLRPDPLLLAARLRTAADPQAAKGATGVRRRHGLRAGLRAVGNSPRARLALFAIVAAHGCMVAVMSMTPLHLQLLTEGPMTGMPAGHVHAASTDVLVLIGFTISLHIAGMYALSPVMGWLTDKTGRLPVIVLGHGLILLAVCVAGFGQRQPVLVTVGLVLLGLGWSAATIAALHAPRRERLRRRPGPRPGRLGHPDGSRRGARRRLLRPGDERGRLPGPQPRGSRPRRGSAGRRRPGRGAGPRGPCGGIAGRLRCPDAAGSGQRRAERAMPSRRPKIASPSSAIPSWWNSSDSHTCRPRTAAAVSRESPRST